MSIEDSVWVVFGVRERWGKTAPMLEGFRKMKKMGYKKGMFVTGKEWDGPNGGKWKFYRPRNMVPMKVIRKEKDLPKLGKTINPRGDRVDILTGCGWVVVEYPFVLGRNGNGFWIVERVERFREVWEDISPEWEGEEELMW